MSTRLVAARTTTPSLAVKPSISTSSWFRVCSRSSWPPPRPLPLWRPTASISSMKMMAGEFCLAWRNRSRTRLAPTPTYISTKSEPEMDRNFTPASPATALASKVLPVPGGPTSSTPLGIRAPRARYLSGWRRNSTISRSSSFSSSSPATSWKVTLLSWGVSCTRASPKWDIRSWAPPGPAPVIRAIRFISRMNPRITTTYGSRSCSQLVEWSA